MPYGYNSVIARQVFLHLDFRPREGILRQNGDNCPLRVRRLHNDRSTGKQVAWSLREELPDKRASIISASEDRDTRFPGGNLRRCFAGRHIWQVSRDHVYGFGQWVAKIAYEQA